MSLGIGLCVNQTRAVFEALLGRETEFVRTPKHGIRGKLRTISCDPMFLLMEGLRLLDEEQSQDTPRAPSGSTTPAEK